jgi:hypothetical protein
MKRYRRLFNDIDRIVILRQGSDGQRQVVDSKSAAPAYTSRNNIKARIIRNDGQQVVKLDGIFGTRRKKQSRALRPMEKLVRKHAKRKVRIMQRYLNLHERSNQKKLNGWIRDYLRNAVKSVRRGY